MNDEKKQLVSIGLPVFNGDNYLAEAIESVLGQTYKNFELLISDNASTDKTGEICQRYASQDNRIRYYKNDHNLGANPNFNRLVALASGTFFKWMAHDDLVSPDYLEKAIAKMDSHPDAVVCHTAVKMIDERGNRICTNENKLQGTASLRVYDRLGALILEDPNCQSVFALFRTNILRRTRLFHIGHNGDRLLMVELALQGPLVHINEPLFWNRIHGERYTQRPISFGLTHGATWFDMSEDKKRDFPLWRSYFEYFRLVATKVDHSADRWRCYRQLVTWWFANFNAIKMLVELVAFVEPRVLEFAQAIKHRFFGTSIDYFRSRENIP